MVSLQARHTGIDTLVEVSGPPRLSVSGFLNPGLLFFNELFVKGAGYSVIFAGEMGEAAEDGGVVSDRFERDVALSVDRDEDIERLF